MGQYSAWRKKIFNYLKTKGLAETIKIGYKNLIHYFSFDRRFGTDTDGVINLGDVDPDLKGLQYVATYPKTFQKIMSYIPIRHEDFIFVDLGAGKGRTVLLAANYKFKRIIGVEILDELCRIAKKNIAIYKNKRQKCHDIEIACMDAADYPIPDENAVFYLYNPFYEKIAATVLSRIKASLEKHPRKIFIICVGQIPFHRDLYEKSGFLKLFKFKEFYRFKSNVQKRACIYTNIDKRKVLYDKLAKHDIEAPADAERILQSLRNNSMGIAIEEINNINDALRLRPDWDRIVEEGNLDVFQSFDFVMSLWETHTGKGDITLLIAKEGTEVLGIFPLVSQKSYIFGVLPVNTISLLKGPIPGTNDFIIKDNIPESIDALLEHLFASRFKCDIFEITGYYGGITDDSRVSCWLKHSKHEKIIKRKIFPVLYIRLADSWEKYWQSRSGHFRQRMQRSERRLEEEGTFEVKYFSSPDEMDFAMDKMHEITRESQHARERRSGGVVTNDDHVKDVKDAFYGTYLKKSAMTGNILAMFLCINNEYAAYILTFVYKKRCYESTTYYKAKFSEYSPGFILLKYVVKKLFELGTKEYMIGVSSWPGLHHLEWKNRWATGKDENYWVWVYNDKRPRALLIYYLRSLSGFFKKNKVALQLNSDDKNRRNK